MTGPEPKPSARKVAISRVRAATALYMVFNAPKSAPRAIKTATINLQTFSQIAFAFAVTPQLLINAMMCATIIGFIGGLFPAVRAVRMPIASGLRAV